MCPTCRRVGQGCPSSCGRCSACVARTDAPLDDMPAFFLFGGRPTSTSTALMRWSRERGRRRRVVDAEAVIAVYGVICS